MFVVVVYMGGLAALDMGNTFILSLLQHRAIIINKITNVARYVILDRYWILIQYKNDTQSNNSMPSKVVFFLYTKI